MNKLSPELMDEINKASTEEFFREMDQQLFAIADVLHIEDLKKEGIIVVDEEFVSSKRVWRGFDEADK